MGQLLENTVLGGVMILASALIRRLLRGRMGPHTALLLWALCIMRLLTPVPVRSPPVRVRTVGADGAGP